MYYKILTNGTVTDAVKRVAFVRYQDKHGLIVPCSEDAANGILADNGEIYHADGLPAFPQGDYADARGIGRAEYLTLCDYLGKTVEPEVGDVAILREQLARQQAMIDYLSMMTDVETEAAE